MRTLFNLNVPKDTQAKFPFGTIQNETDTQEGTPVVRELYGDILTNIYKILEVTKTIPTGNEDSNDSQYQLIDALRKFHNTLNDVEQVVTLVGTVWTISLALEILPDKYVFIGRAAENYNPSITYQFKGSGVTLLNASSPTGFSANDEVLTVIDLAGVRMYSLTKLTGTDTTSFNVLGAPISFNDTATPYYLESGKIYTDAPAIFNIEETIQNTESNGALIVSDAIVLNGFVLAMVFDPGAVAYSMHALPLSNLNSSDEVNFSGFVPSAGTDNQPYLYCDGQFVYFSNDFNNDADDKRLSKFSFDEVGNELTFVSVSTMDGAFKKTTNSVVNNNKIYTFINSTLNSYDVDSGVLANVLIDFTLFYGVIFKFNGAIYYTKDEVAAQWTI